MDIYLSLFVYYDILKTNDNTLTIQVNNTRILAPWGYNCRSKVSEGCMLEDVLFLIEKFNEAVYSNRVWHLSLNENFSLIISMNDALCFCFQV